MHMPPCRVKGVSALKAYAVPEMTLRKGWLAHNIKNRAWKRPIIADWRKQKNNSSNRCLLWLSTADESKSTNNGFKPSRSKGTLAGLLVKLHQRAKADKTLAALERGRQSDMLLLSGFLTYDSWFSLWQQCHPNTAVYLLGDEDVNVPDGCYCFCLKTLKNKKYSLCFLL